MTVLQAPPAVVSYSGDRTMTDFPRPVDESSSESVLDFLIDLFRRRGASMYAGEPVTQTEHALQAAYAAERVRSPQSLVAAALLHDVGHLLHDLPEDCAEEGTDDEHERLGAEWLKRYFPPEVTEPIRLHVPAKRYRCAIDEVYYQRLSPASQLSLKLQGGPMSAAEVEEFRNHPHASDALVLRNWDEAAKVRGLRTPDLEHYRELLAAVIRI
jgi:phosphonate degradation associated HDIG domain protein